MNLTENAKNHSGYLGAGAIQFRNEAQDSVKYPNGAHSWYVLNGLGNGWFRCNDGYIAHGYGLAINKLQPTSNRPEAYGCGKIYKAKMDYTTHAGEPDSALVWLFIHDDTTLADVLKYIEANKDGWYP